jgi:hypothetical protein
LGKGVSKRLGNPPRTIPDLVVRESDSLLAF